MKQTEKHNHSKVARIKELQHRTGAERRTEWSPHRVGLAWVVPHMYVGVVEGFFYRDAAFGINDQHFRQQVSCLARCYGNRGGAVLLWKQDYDLTSFRKTS